MVGGWDGTSNFIWQTHCSKSLENPLKSNQLKKAQSLMNIFWIGQRLTHSWLQRVSRIIFSTSISNNSDCYRKLPSSSIHECLFGFNLWHKKQTNHSQTNATGRDGTLHKQMKCISDQIASPPIKIASLPIDQDVISVELGFAIVVPSI